ncbi:cytochrome P450 2J6-like [Pecten maximus]|uniref:cytochrome P450 2J6-like n=1 Tax=Pecten maximus TaxID=6579 RepID=UPI001458D6D2|nr:cytochrome P450 2J6-like [Pecten maximus]
MELDSLLSFNGVTLAIFVVLLVLLIRWFNQWPANIPPSPPGYPIVGHIPLMLKGKPQDIYRGLRPKYGDVFSLKLGRRLSVIINGSEALREAFIKQAEDFSDRPDIFLMSVLLKKKGIAASSGEHWKRTRTLALSTLRGFGFGKKSLEGRVLEEAEAFLSVIEKQNGTPYSATSIIQVMISNIICSIVFGERFDYDDNKFKKLLDMLEELGRLNPIAGVMNVIPWIRYLPGDIIGMKKFARLFQTIFDFIQEEIAEHKRTYDEDNLRDFIDAFLRQKSKHDLDDPVFDDFNIEASVLNLFVAGTGTTASTTQWAILFLLHHRDIQNKLRDEISTVVGSGRYPSLNDKPNMPFYEAFITEVIRKGNIAPLSVPHGATNDIQFRGMTIPKGSLITANLDSVLNDPDTFTDPDKFDPYRFLGEDGQLTGKEKSVMAFSLGRRVCLGESLARLELFLILTSLVQRFDLVPEDPDCLPTLLPVPGATLPQPYKFRALKRT